MKLTEKQKRFADYYIELGNGAEAARKAGYKGSNHDNIATENLRKVAIKEYIDKRMNKLDSKRIMGLEEALELLSSIARGELQDSVVVSGGWGYEVIQKEPDINQRKDAVKELIKRHSLRTRESLQEKLLEAQIKKTEAEVISEENGTSRTVIVKNEDEMRKVMNNDN